MQTTTEGNGDIRLRSVSKTFGATTALDDFSLVIRDKELLVLLGPSGCGKSTTLNILAGLEQPTTGELYFGDRLMNGIPAEKRDVSMVFQTIGLYPHLNVLDNITFPLRLQKVPQETISQRVEEMVEILGIRHLLGRQLIEVSGGERQRVSIAKALIKRPELFLLDEPFSSLDADRRRQLRADLVRIHRQLDTTMVFVTHDQEEAMSVADRIAVMSEARLQQVGSPLEIHNVPVNLWVAQFVGSHPINIMDAYWEETQSEISLFTPEGPRARISEVLCERLRSKGVGPSFVLGVRPDFLRLTTPHDNKELRGEVFTRQVLGDQILYLIRLGEHELRAVAPAQYRLELGENVALELDSDRVFVFDRETEECLIN